MENNGPSPALFFETINAYQKSSALKAALELDFFTAVDGASTAAEIAGRCQASARGVRILADTLTILGFLHKDGDRYSLTPDSATFLSRHSPAYAGGAAQFLLSEELVSSFDSLADAVRKGGTAHSALGTLAPEHPVWVEFARGMAPLMIPPAEALAAVLPLYGTRPARVLDISASHGMYGIAFARRHPTSHLVALDWAPVLEVARANAEAAGVAERFSTIAGDAFEVDLGSEYDLVLVPNFLHHFAPPECIRFLRKVHAALRAGGQVAIVEFVPNADRITPPPVASFALVMLATTPAGDAYTFAEFDSMLRAAGFAEAEQHPLPPSVATAIVAAK
jgi:2-polyprenyl-3-methyl-5-hydroxy-6-metoxy-1,4-benzoquinol methylase